MNLPWPGPCNDSLTPREGRGREGWEWGTPPFSKLPAGARRRAEQGARRNIRARRTPSRGVVVVFVVVSSGGLLGRDLRLVVACLWRSGPWKDPFVGARSRWESGRVTRDADGRRRFSSSVAQACASVWRAPERARRAHGRPESAAAIRAAVATDVETRPSRHHEGAGNLPRSLGARSVTKAPRHKGLRTPSDSLAFEGSLSFLLNECCGTESDK